MSRQPPTSHRRTISTSRWRAALRALLAAGLVFAGWNLTRETGSPEVSAAYWDWVGGAIMALSSLAFVAWLPAVVMPHRLIIGDEGFVVRTFWRGDKIYHWADIARVWNTSPFWDRSFVRWSNKVDGQIPRRPTHKNDGTLPSDKMWSLSNDDIVAAMNLAKGRYERAQTKGA